MVEKNVGALSGAELNEIRECIKILEGLGSSLAWVGGDPATAAGIWYSLKEVIEKLENILKNTERSG